jgi:hypothetical protein
LLFCNIINYVFYDYIYILVWHDDMVSFGSLFRLIKSHLGLVSVNETSSKSLLGLLLVLLVSFGSPFGLFLVSPLGRPYRSHYKVSLWSSPFGLANDETQKRPKETKMRPKRDR